MKLRYKDTCLLIPGFVLSIIFSFSLSRLTLLYYTYHFQAHDKSSSTYYTDTLEHMVEYQPNFGLKVTFAIILAVHSIRVLFLLRASRTFGPMIEIIINMLKEIMKFMVIQTVIIFIFIGSMRIICSEVDQFASLKDTIITFFSASLGAFNLRVFETGKMEMSRWYGYVPMMLYLMISGVALLNFLIALISNVFSDLNAISIGLYRKSLIEIRQYLQDDERYSSLVSSVPPLNFIPFLFLPFIVWFESPRLNTALLHYEYLTVVVLGVILYLIISHL